MLKQPARPIQAATSMKLQAKKEKFCNTLPTFLLLDGGGTNLNSSQNSRAAPEAGSKKGGSRIGVAAYESEIMTENTPGVSRTRWLWIRHWELSGIRRWVALDSGARSIIEVQSVYTFLDLSLHRPPPSLPWGQCARGPRTWGSDCSLIAPAWPLLGLENGLQEKCGRNLKCGDTFTLSLLPLCQSEWRG